MQKTISAAHVTLISMPLGWMIESNLLNRIHTKIEATWQWRGLTAQRIVSLWRKSAPQIEMTMFR